MATKKPMKKFKRFDEGGPVDEATAKQRGLDASNKEAPMGFFERIRAGNIDDPSSEAYKRFGAGRGRATAATTTETKPQIVARIPPKPRELTPNEQSGYMQNLISSGSDIVGRPQNEGYRPNAGTASERAMLEGAFDSDKITENTGPRTKPIVKTPVKPVASKPVATKPKETEKSSQYPGAMRGMRSDAGASPPAQSSGRSSEDKSAASKIPSQSTKAPQGGEKADSSETGRNIGNALMAVGAGGAAASAYKLKKMYDASKAAKKALLKNPRLERPGTVTGKDFVVRDYEGAAKAGSKGVPKKQLGYSKDTDVTDVMAKKRGGAVKKYASGGMVSSASKRADGIATKGKTRCKIC
jgi:hypothetical protein